jgi:hypothetical protein
MQNELGLYRDTPGQSIQLGTVWKITQERDSNDVGKSASILDHLNGKIRAKFFLPRSTRRARFDKS